MILKFNKGGVVKLQNAATTIPTYYNSGSTFEDAWERSQERWDTKKAIEAAEAKAAKRIDEENKGFLNNMRFSGETGEWSKGADTNARMAKYVAEELGLDGNQAFFESYKKDGAEGLSRLLQGVGIALGAGTLAGNIGAYGLFGGIGTTVGQFAGSDALSWGGGKIGGWLDNRLGTNFFEPALSLAGLFKGWNIGAKYGYGATKNILSKQMTRQMKKYGNINIPKWWASDRMKTDIVNDAMRAGWRPKSTNNAETFRFKLPENTIEDQGYGFAFKQGGILKAQNTSQPNINNAQIARKGGIMSYRKGKRTYNPYTDTTTNPDNDPYVSEYFEYDVMPRYQREHPNATQKELDAIRETYGKYPSVYDSSLRQDDFRGMAYSAGDTMYALGVPVSVPSDKISRNNQYIQYADKNPLRSTVVHETNHILRQGELGSMIPQNLSNADNYIAGAPPIFGVSLHSGYNRQEADYLDNAYGLENYDFNDDSKLWKNHNHEAKETRESGATNTELRYVLWRELYTKLGRRPTLEEMDNYISNYRDSDLMGKLKNENGYGSHSVKEQPMAAPVKQALIHVADNNEQEQQIDGNQLVRTGGIIKGKPSYQNWLKTVNPDFIDKNYDLETAYDNLPFELLEAWRKNPEDNHLPSGVELPNGNWQYLKSPLHKSWFLNNAWEMTKEGKEWKNKYQSDNKFPFTTLIPKGQHGLLTPWYKAYNSKFGQGIRNLMFGKDYDLSDEEYIQKYGYAKPITGTGMLPGKTSMNPFEGVENLVKGSFGTGAKYNAGQQIMKTNAISKTVQPKTTSNWDKFLKKSLDEQNKIVKYWDERYSTMRQLQANQKQFKRFVNWINKQ